MNSLPSLINVRHECEANRRSVSFTHSEEPDQQCSYCQQDIKNPFPDLARIIAETLAQPADTPAPEDSPR